MILGQKSVSGQIPREFLGISDLSHEDVSLVSVPGLKLLLGERGRVLLGAGRKSLSYLHRKNFRVSVGFGVLVGSLLDGAIWEVCLFDLFLSD